MPFKDREKQNQYLKDWKLKSNSNYDYAGRSTERRLKNPKKWMLWQAKHRAKLKGMEFSITEDDIIFPVCCPILGIELNFHSTKAGNYSSPSLDRVDNTKGYIKGNVRVISKQANSYKSNMSVDTVRKLLAYMEGKN